ncbi:MAG TPA: hypothetical protein VFQ65_29190 [Kofleriaceae bacterium]|nr:hypothetical protein [Kofleriaceae bacterium]
MAKWVLVLVMVSSTASAATRWTIKTTTGDAVLLDAARTATGYRVVMHDRKDLWRRPWSAIPCPGDGDLQAGETLLDLVRQPNGSFVVTIYKARLFPIGPEGMGTGPASSCVFQPVHYTGRFVNRAVAAASDRNQVDGYPTADDSFLVLESNREPCPVPDDRKYTCSVIWPMISIVDAPLVDTDGDGIPDEWELSGLTEGGQTLDLHAMGANPDHKDLFIQMDSAPGATLFDEVQLQIADYLATLPVSNPDGHPGITLHLDSGDHSFMVGNQTWGSRSRANVHLSIPAEFTTAHGCDHPDKTPLTNLMRDNLEPLRAKVFRYVVVVRWVVADHSCYSGMNWNIPSKAFVIGDWADTGIVEGTVQEGLFLHELGHSLGLFHAGGVPEPQYKPNYQSVMNYAYQEYGIPRRDDPDGLGLYVYSSVDPSPSNSIDETRLADDTGLPAVAMTGTLLDYACTGDPNATLIHVAPGVPADLRCDGNSHTPAPNDITASDGNHPAVLQTYNDVAHLSLPLADGTPTWGAGRSVAPPEGRSLAKAVHDHGVRIGDRQPPTVQLSLKTKGSKRQVTIKAHDDRGLASAVVTSGALTRVVQFGKMRTRTKDATQTVDVEPAGDVTVVVSDVADKSVTATTK